VVGGSGPHRGDVRGEILAQVKSFDVTDS